MQKFSLNRVLVYGVFSGITFCLLELAIGYRYYSASLHGDGFNPGLLNLLPFIIPVTFVIVIYKVSGEDLKTRLAKTLLFGLIFLTSGIISLVYLPSLLYFSNK